MRGTWQTTDGGGSGLLAGLVVVGLILAMLASAAAAVSELFIVLMAVFGGVVLLLLVLGGWWLLRMHRRGDFSPVVRWQPQALPAPERKAAPPVQPAQQITNNYNFYGIDPADVARAVAEQQAINQER